MWYQVVKMNVFIFVCITISTLFISDVLCGESSPVVQCKGQSFDNLQERIAIVPCGKSRCKLRKGSDIHVTFKFRTTKTVQDLKNEVYADILGLPLPFIGVTGEDACPSIKRADDGSPAPCPLEPNQEYIYTNVFPIESFYPEVNLRVHWALRDGTRDVICFEVPAVIAPKRG